jgi:hypothetical protein
MKSLVIYKTQQSIPDDSYEIFAPLSLFLAQKEHINATLYAQVVFTKDDELQRIPVYKLDDQIQIIFGLSEKHHNSLIMIFESIIEVALNYTRRGRVSPISGELVGTLDPIYCLRTRMIIDDRR